jgi:hypothetical protein
MNISRRAPPTSGWRQCTMGKVGPHPEIGKPRQIEFAMAAGSATHAL